MEAVLRGGAANPGRGTGGGGETTAATAALCFQPWEEEGTVGRDGFIIFQTFRGQTVKQNFPLI